MSNYDCWSAKELEQTVNRLQHMVGTQTMTIEELRESLSGQVDLIESLESDRDAWKAKESKCANELTTQKTLTEKYIDKVHDLDEQIEALETALRDQETLAKYWLDKLNDTDAKANDLEEDRNTWQRVAASLEEAVKKLTAELGHELTQITALRNELEDCAEGRHIAERRLENLESEYQELQNNYANLKVAYASSSELGKDREIEALSAQLRALREQYKALQIVKDDYLAANTALRERHNAQKATLDTIQRACKETDRP